MMLIKGFLPAASLVLLLSFCSDNRADNQARKTTGGTAVDDGYLKLRLEMVDRQIRRRGVTDPRVLKAMAEVPRHLFVPPSEVGEAYEDHPLPIGYDQTISQPYIVALMTESLELGAGDRVLEIGTGSGYQAAVLSLLVKQVFSMEIVEPLGRSAAERLKELGYDNVQVRVGDGYEGWPEEAPFDAIIVTAAPDTVPQPLIDQLATGGRMVIPVGEYYQELLLAVKHHGRIERRSIASVRFVPMVGKPKKGDGREEE
jgi:protein-L-isoaspartate(D-aspartate) O-methyltransferase